MRWSTLSRVAIGTAAAALFAAVSLGSPIGAVAQDKLVLKLGHEDADGERRDNAAHRLAELASEYSDGRIEIEIYPAGQLGKYAQVVEGMQIGTHDMTITLALVIGLAPQLGVFDLPYLFKDRESFERVVNSPLGDELLGTLEPAGIVGLAYWESGYRHITNNTRPIVNPEDLDGIKLRTPPSPSRVAMFRQFGANPGPLPFTELYSALQQGVFDGQENPLPNIRGAKLHEVQDYLSLSGHVYDPQLLLISKLKWDVMDEDLQDALRRAARQVAEEMRREGQQLDDEDLAFLKEHLDVNEVDFAAFQAASGPLYEEFAYPEILERLLEASNAE